MKVGKRRQKRTIFENIKKCWRQEWRTIKAIEDQGEEQLKAIKDQEEKQLKLLQSDANSANTKAFQSLKSLNRLN